jgi:hypothetical protein
MELMKMHNFIYNPIQFKIQTRLALAEKYSRLKK